jgi:indole-3-glycerol phosphate synthase
LSAQTNSGTVLDRILEARRAEVEHRKCVLPETALKYGAKAASPVRDFYSALSRDGLNIIAELKPASPSRGVIREPFDAPELAKCLSQAGAAALSVLTEGEYFHGSLKNLRDARKAMGLPVLRKDFIFDPWQVWEARANDADSFLLIVAVLSDSLLRDLIDRALAASAKIVGVNNRDLKTMAVRIETSLELIEQIPENCVAVSESGIRNHQDLVKMRHAGFDAFLIGEHLMTADDPGAALFELLGQPRVTREQFDAASAATDAKNGNWQN